MTKPKPRTTPDAKVRSIFDAAIAKGFRLGTDGKEFYYNAPHSDPETDKLLQGIREHWREMIPIIQALPKRK